MSEVATHVHMAAHLVYKQLPVQAGRDLELMLAVAERKVRYSGGAISCTPTPCCCCCRCAGCCCVTCHHCTRHVSSSVCRRKCVLLTNMSTTLDTQSSLCQLLDACSVLAGELPCEKSRHGSDRFRASQGTSVCQLRQAPGRF
jgi:hypothetical protein